MVTAIDMNHLSPTAHEYVALLGYKLDLFTLDETELIVDVVYYPANNPQVHVVRGSTPLLFCVDQRVLQSVVRMCRIMEERYGY